MNEYNECMQLKYKDKSDGLLIKFGKCEHLYQIKDGRVRFAQLKKYQQLENTKNMNHIYDENEGLESISYPGGEEILFFVHPKVNDGKLIDITESVVNMKVFPLNISALYISCFSYFTIDDVDKKNIFSDQMINKEGWDYVLMLYDTSGFFDGLQSILEKNYNLKHEIVKYCNFEKNQNGMNEFCKSKCYEYEKEYRFSMSFDGKETENIKKVDEQTIEVNLNKSFEYVIVPAKEFKNYIYKNIKFECG